jgi:hypothetical protein
MIEGRICDKHPELGGKRYNDGKCCQCRKDINRKWDSDNKERVREAANARMRRFRETEEGAKSVREAKMRHYRKDIELSRNKSRENRKNDYLKNPAQEIMRVRERRDTVKNRTPAWADRNAINAIYLRARDLGMTVDHVVPLRGRNVSGLHVESNLQIIPRSENSSKGNRF